MARSEVISRVANTLVQISPQHSLRVAIDGITAVGKMTFADKLAEDVRARGRPCVRVSMEDFRQPSAVRFSRGRDSVEGYYENAYDYGVLRSELLHPLGPTGNGSYRSRFTTLLPTSGSMLQHRVPFPV